MITRTGKFITEEERLALKTAFDCSGMFLSGGAPVGDPGFEADQLCKRYGMSADHGINLKTGEFCKT